MKWAEAWLGGYWSLTAGILLFGPGANQDTYLLALLQLLAAAFSYIFSAWCDRHRRVSWLRWVPWAPLIGWTYKNIENVQMALGRPFIDKQLQHYEKAIWGGSPAMAFSQWLPFRPFSEFLHYCYASFFFMLAVLILRQLFRGREDLGRIALGGAYASLVCCYSGSVLFPAVGPRPLYPALDAALHGPAWKLCHDMSREGAAAAAAFPSGHCAFATACLVLCWKLDRRLRWIYAVWAAGVILATVYGRFHYTLDSVAGIFIGMACAEAVLKHRPYEVGEETN